MTTRDPDDPRTDKQKMDQDEFDNNAKAQANAKAAADAAAKERERVANLPSAADQHAAAKAAFTAERGGVVPFGSEEATIDGNRAAVARREAEGRKETAEEKKESAKEAAADKKEADREAEAHKKVSHR